jgi:hypothetical protein
MLRLRWRSFSVFWPRSMLACLPLLAMACVNSVLRREEPALPQASKGGNP